MKDYVITQERIQEVIPALQGKLGGWATRKAMRWFGIDRLNGIYKRCLDPDAVVFCRNVLEDAGINLVLENREVLDRFGEKPFVTISNHPYGHIETLGLISVIGAARPDYKFMGNVIFDEIEVLSGRMVGVRPSQKKYGVAESAFETTAETLDHIRAGHPFGFYPGGGVSGIRYEDGKFRVTDPKWRVGTVSLIERAGVPVIPVYFSGHNSFWYNALGVINIHLRDARLIRELGTKKGKTVYMRFGEPIHPEKLTVFSSKKELSAFLRASVYKLGNRPEKAGLALGEEQAAGTLEPVVLYLPDYYTGEYTPYAEVLSGDENAVA